MIGQLMEYARRRSLDPEPGFAPKVVKWALEFAADGRYLGLRELGDAAASRNPGRSFPRCPDLSQGELVTLKGCHFLVETLSVVACQEADAKAEAKHAFFTGLLRRAEELGLAVVADALDDADVLARIRVEMAEAKARPTDKVTLLVGGAFPVESGIWHGWWRRFRAALRPEVSGDGAARMVCFATGETVEPAATHQKIAGLSDVGGIGMGSPLIGFDKDAFVSFGLRQSANAAMSEQAAAAYRAALNELIAHHGRRLTGAKMVHWYRDRVAEDDDPLPWLEEPPEMEETAAQRRAADLLRAIRAGARPDLAGNRYYALTLSGAGGRVMVRDWMEGPFEDLVAAVEAWFGDLRIVRRDGVGTAPRPKLAAVLGASARELGEVPAPRAARVWRCALRREPIPRELMALALARTRIDIIQGGSANHARMGLLRAYHARLKGGKPVDVYLNESHPAAAYQCGRLMAVLAALQSAAIPNLDAGVVQRFYAAASATPSLVLGRLIRTSNFHLNKLGGGLAREFENRIAAICGRVGDAMPATLTLDEQSLFALGYYQQLAHDRAMVAERAARKKQGGAPGSEDAEDADAAKGDDDA